MKVVCHLRQIRGSRTLAQISEQANVPVPALSQIERGVQLPRDTWLPGLEQAYGQPRHLWYPPELLLVLQADETQP